MAFEIFWPLTLRKTNEKFQNSNQLLICRSENYDWQKFYICTHIWMVYLKFKFYWVFSESESQVDLKQPKAICLLSARKTVLDTDYIGSTKYNSSCTYFNKLNFTILSKHIFSKWHISTTPHKTKKTKVEFQAASLHFQ